MSAVDLDAKRLTDLGQVSGERIQRCFAGIVSKGLASFEGAFRISVYRVGSHPAANVDDVGIACRLEQGPKGLSQRNHSEKVGFKRGLENLGINGNRGVYLEFVSIKPAQLN